MKRQLFALTYCSSFYAAKATYFYGYNMSWIKILVDNKLIFDQPIRNNHEVYEKLVAMRGNNDCTTKTVILFSSSRYCKLIVVDLKRQTIPNLPQKINIIGNGR